MKILRGNLQIALLLWGFLDNPPPAPNCWLPSSYTSGKTSHPVSPTLIYPHENRHISWKLMLGRWFISFTKMVPFSEDMRHAFTFRWVLLLHPQKFHMEPRNDGFPVSKKNLLFQGLMFRFHVTLQGVHPVSPTEPCSIQFPRRLAKTVDSQFRPHATEDLTDALVFFSCA